MLRLLLFDLIKVSILFFIFYSLKLKTFVCSVRAEVKIPRNALNYEVVWFLMCMSVLVKRFFIFRHSFASFMYQSLLSKLTD